MLWYAPGTSGWGFALMTVGTVLSWALIIFGVIVVVRHLTAGGDRRRKVRPTPDELLAERFARGDIDEPEYHQRLDALHGGPGRLLKP
jgi:putative membrane protein